MEADLHGFVGHTAKLRVKPNRMRNVANAQRVRKKDMTRDVNGARSIYYLVLPLLHNITQ
jgi:hypothetical protein